MRMRIGSLCAVAMMFMGVIGNAQSNEMTAAQKEQLALVPDELKPVYDGFFHTTELHRMAADWKPHSAPWQFCYSESFTGNSWRNAILEQLKKQVAAYSKAGLSRGDLIVTNSNGDVNLQLTQLNSLVAQGCDVVFSVPMSPTALCQGVQDAAKKGVLFVTLESPVFCPEAINVAQNAFQSALGNARWLAKAMNGKGNVLVVQGMAGNHLTDSWEKAIDAVLKENPGLKRAGEVHGNWTASVAKTETLKFVATHPAQIDGVWSGGLMGLAAVQALTQSGRKAVPTSDMDNECNWVAYMKKSADIPTRGLVDGGGPVAFLGFSVAGRILGGQRPHVNTILYNLPQISQENIDDYFESSMTLESSCWANPKDGRLVPDSYLDAFFVGDGKPPVMIAP